MPKDYVGETDAEKIAWLKNFAEKLSAAPSTYQISGPEAAGIQSAVDAADAAYQDALDPAQRTPAIVDLKDQMRNSALQLCRQFAQMIRLNQGIPDEDKILAGVRPINPNREPIFCPVSAPAIIVVAATLGAHTMRFVDTLNPEARGKPFGATELQLWVAVAETPVSDPTQAKYYNKFSKNPLSVAFTHADNGMQASYFARWAGRRGDVSNWSAPVSMAIAA
jgi:hypothetical protein